jgi:hypothetical protein
MANPLLDALDIKVESITDADRSAATLAVTLCLDRDHTRHSLSKALTVLFAQHRETAEQNGREYALTKLFQEEPAKQLLKLLSAIPT